MVGPVPVSERGYSSASATSWWQMAAGDDETPELRWPSSVDVYNRMRRQDAQVMSVLRAVMLPIRRTAWRVDPAGSKVTVAKFVADELGLPVVGRPEKPAGRTRDRFSWADHLQLALLMLPFGHSFFEQVYRIDDAGKARLRKLAWRPPSTVSNVEVATDGGLVAVHQYGRGPTGKEIVLPVDRIVAYVNDREGANWFGTSLLRPAYKFWLLKDRALRTQAQTLDRNGLGVPVYYGAQPPDGVLVNPDDAEQWQEDDLAAGKALASAFRAGDNSGAAVPFSAKLKLQGVEGTLPNADPVIRYYDEQIARAVLAHFLNLGTETGSWALGSTFADFFTLSLQTVAMQVADVATQHVVEDLVDLNFGESEPAPRIVFDEIGSRHPATADAIKMLVDCGAVTPDEPLDRHLRTTYGLPEADPATARRPAPTPPGPAPSSPQQAAPDDQGGTAA